MLTAEQILSVKGPEPIPIEVPEWGGTVYVRVMTGDQRDRFELASIAASNGRDANTSPTVNGSPPTVSGHIRARLIAYTVCDAEGRLLFGEKDVAALGELPAPGLDVVFTVAARINKIMESDVEELAKNSPGGLSAASGSS